tara:strand:- start:6202 stop:6636 length:435 start_codon:yes stop_codon:yes gene_type:complete
MTDNLLLQHILYKSKYSNLKEFSRACQEYLLQNRSRNWTNAQSLYVRLRDNLIGDSETIFNKKRDEIRNQYLIKAIGELLFLHPSEVIYLANKKIDKVKQINDLQDQINVSKRQFQECNLDEHNEKIDILLKMIQNLNQIINLK